MLADGTWLTADVIVDAGGEDTAPRSAGWLVGSAPRTAIASTYAPRSTTHPVAARHATSTHCRRAQGTRSLPAAGRRLAAEQTAYGVVVDAATAAPFVGPGEALVMDWRPDHGEPGWPTFLYAVPLGGDAVLLEETSLARRPGLPLPVLRRRLHARLAHHGVTAPSDARVERVRFPVDRPRHATPGVLGFGAAAPLVHPATGFSVAEALRLAPSVADALATGGVPAAQRLIWPARAVAVHRLRRIGLEALLRMPPEAVPAFFETFFALPERHRRAYLSGRDDLAGHLAAMGALFGHADARLRRRLVTPAFRGRAPSPGSACCARSTSGMFPARPQRLRASRTLRDVALIGVPSAAEWRTTRGNLRPCPPTAPSSSAPTARPRRWPRWTAPPRWPPTAAPSS